MSFVERKLYPLLFEIILYSRFDLDNVLFTSYELLLLDLDEFILFMKALS